MNEEFDKTEFDCVVFDLDGVVTNTAKLHAQAWKRLFDDYLKQRDQRDGEPFRPFDREHDYLAYVDGKPRYEGVRSFLESRNIEIATGNIEDDPEQESVYGLGNKKDQYFDQLLKKQGVEIFPSTIELIKDLRTRGIKLAIVSSSKHCQEILQAANIEELFLVRVDGVISESLALKGKPDPDIFIHAAESMGCERQRTVVIEDAIAGVEAGRAGNFGLVIGVNRADQAGALKTRGADIVVDDLVELTIGDINDWFKSHRPSDSVGT